MRRAEMNLATLSDSALLAAYIGGTEPDAFEEMHRRYSSIVHSVCRRILRNQADAEDATLSCFVVFHRSMPKLANEQNLGSWLYWCAHYTSMNMLRSRSRQAVHEKEALKMQTAVADGTEAANDDLLALIEAEIGALPGAQRQAVIMKFYRGMTEAEISRSLARPLGTVATQIKRALDRIRTHLLRRGARIAETDLLGNLSGTALIIPVPYSMELKLGAIAKGETMTVTVMEIADATMRSIMWAKVKLAAGIAAAVVCGVAVPAVVATSMLSVTHTRENGAVITAAATNSESQVEIIYEDHFNAATLSDFWERVEPTNQVTLADPAYKSALVLRASGAGAREKFKPTVALVSRSVDATKDILEVTFTERRPYVTGDKIGQNAAFNGTYLCDDSGNNLNVEPYPENPGSAGKSTPSVITMAGDYEVSISTMFVFANGDALALGKDASFWGRLKDKPKSVRLKIILEMSDPSASATWPVDKVTVRRMKNLPEDAAKVLAGIRAGTKTLETAGAREDLSGQKKQK
ncbi:MAG: hypothetical protein C0404_07705 [Verrucomicrobia bacterium]|nr:hypothetical protein [Verrucomicrobiota bacterium]